MLVLHIKDTLTYLLTYILICIKILWKPIQLLFEGHYFTGSG